MSTKLLQRRLPTRRPLALLIHAFVVHGALVSAAAAAPALPDPSVQASSASAATSARKTYKLPSAPLEDALNAFSRQAGVTLSFNPVLVSGKKAPALAGNYSVAEGFAALLAGSGLIAVAQGPGTYGLRAAGNASLMADEVKSLAMVTVEGSRDPNMLYKPFPGGQVAKGARLGALGNTELLDAPFAISAYTEQAARDVQARRLVDVLAVDPAVRSTNSESNAVDVFFLRGLFLLSADISFNETFAVVDTRRIAVEQFERVEVLKGPSALLNGIGPNSTTNGGTINLVPKRGTDVPLTRFTLSGSSQGQVGGHLDVGRRFGEDKQWGLRFNKANRGGSTGVTSEKVGTDHTSMALDYAGDKLRASVDVAHNRRQFDGFPQFLAFNSGFRIPAPPPTSQSISQAWDSSDTESTSVVTRLEYDLTPDSTIFGVMGGVNFRESNLNAGTTRLVAANGNFTAQPSLFATGSDLRASEAGWRVRFNTGAVKHRVVVGYSRFTGQGQSVSRPIGGAFTNNLYHPVLVAQPTPPVAGPFLRFQDTTSDSVSVVDSMHLLDDRLHLIAGLRYQKLDIGQYIAGVETKRFEQSATAPSAGISYKLTPALSVYGNYAEGLSQGPVAPLTTTNRGQVFAPYKGEQYEAGVKYDAGSFGASAALFQIAQPVSFVNSANVFVLDGEQRNRGLELSVYGEVSKGVRLNAGLALFDVVQARTQNGTNDGKKAIGIPNYSLVLNGEWDLAALPGLTLTGRYTKVASQFASADNAQSIPGFDSYDLGLRYATRVGDKPTVFRLSVENVADASHWLAIRGGFLSRSMPRTALFSVSTDF
ncbi:TonB-dependent receptor [Polaromonas sp. SM01]|uniref:TonB-dependent receptor n=1 Tax=Polaromonas sp. SM01 TaxID=3085630 RepID=UPI002980D135|nr:TonB-dependent receptor [Polaromonas sp. SM01]MDW5441938.1 TonB-dependent receptor [Polaromonas sp. SM01]